MPTGELLSLRYAVLAIVCLNVLTSTSSCDRIIREEGYDNRTRWRASLWTELNDSLEQIIEKYGEKNDLVVDIR